jgi:hypothetical protein
VSSVINVLAGRGLIDPKRVGMGGLSFGSEVVVRPLSRPPLSHQPIMSFTRSRARRLKTMYERFGGSGPLLRHLSAGKRFRPPSIRRRYIRPYSCRCPSRNTSRPWITLSR